MNCMLVLMLLSLLSCETQEGLSSTKSEIKHEEKIEVTSSEKEYWVSNLYLQCIKDKLPC
jgi:hypothetical protein